jgi:hypothetical protein
MRKAFKSDKEDQDTLSVLDDDTSTVENMSYSNIKVIDPVVYGTTWVAWLQVINIMLVNSACSLMWNTASCVPLAASDWLQINFTKMNWLPNSSAIVNSICSFVTGWSYQRFGIKANVSSIENSNSVVCTQLSKH